MTVLAGDQDVRDGGMIQRCERARLSLEPHQAIGICGEEVGEDLERDVAIEPRVARALDDAHATFAQRAEDLIRAEACARCQHLVCGEYTRSGGLRPGGMPKR